MQEEGTDKFGSRSGVWQIRDSENLQRPGALEMSKEADWKSLEMRGCDL